MSMAHTHTTKETSRNVYWMKAKLEMKYKVSNKHEINKQSSKIKTK
jgi:hypothetical protein